MREVCRKVSAGRDDDDAVSIVDWIDWWWEEEIWNQSFVTGLWRPCASDFESHFATVLGRSKRSSGGSIVSIVHQLLQVWSSTTLAYKRNERRQAPSCGRGCLTDLEHAGPLGAKEFWVNVITVRLTSAIHVISRL